MIARLMAAAALCAVAFVVLGYWVTHHPLSRIDVESAGLRGVNTGPAIVFTESGYGTVLAVLGAAGVVTALALRMPVKIPLLILLSQVLSQGAVNLIKGGFVRARPDAWLYRHELGYSYPSGHATTAVVFYGAWLIVTWFSPLPFALRAAGAGVLGLWMLGIGWSRIVLGAHYPTDVIGGYLFGSCWLLTALALATLRDAGLATRHA